MGIARFTGRVSSSDPDPRRRTAQALAAIPALIMLGAGATAATALCWVDSGLKNCCAENTSVPNLDRYCGIWPFGNYCNDSIVSDGQISTVVQGALGQTGKKFSTDANCEYQRNSCALVGCNWLTPNTTVNCVGEVPNGPQCA